MQEQLPRVILMTGKSLRAALMGIPAGALRISGSDDSLLRGQLASSAGNILGTSGPRTCNDFSLVIRLTALNHLLRCSGDF